MKQPTQQLKVWNGEFGKDYTDRNIFTGKELDALYAKRYGVTRKAMNRKFLQKLSRSTRILEVGSNVANQLACLQRMGFKDLYGIEPQGYAVERSKQLTRGINLIKADGFDVPFKDGYFDLVFTSGVLIHINPKDIKKALKEIYRVSGRYIWGFEYYSQKYSQIVYRGKKSLLWKGDFPGLYTKMFPDLKIVKQEFYRYRDGDNIDVMFLLKKNG
jgi:pseudaminic acid biosynthesis-associated methylase